VDGVGVAMGLRPYVEDDLASGRLVAPFKLAVPKGQAWYLVYRPFRQDDAALVAFRGWLMANLKPHPPSPHSTQSNPVAQWQGLPGCRFAPSRLRGEACEARPSGPEKPNRGRYPFVRWHSTLCDKVSFATRRLSQYDAAWGSLLVANRSAGQDAQSRPSGHG